MVSHRVAELASRLELILTPHRSAAGENFVRIRRGTAELANVKESEVAEWLTARAAQLRVAVATSNTSPEGASHEGLAKPDDLLASARCVMEERGAEPDDATGRVSISSDAWRAARRVAQAILAGEPQRSMTEEQLRDQGLMRGTENRS